MATLYCNSVTVIQRVAAKTGKGKMKNKGDKPVEPVDGESRNDDFVSSKKLKMNKADGIKKKLRSATATNGKCTEGKENSSMKDKAKWLHPTKKKWSNPCFPEWAISCTMICVAVTISALPLWFVG